MGTEAISKKSQKLLDSKLVMAVIAQQMQLSLFT